ncbi:MAG: ABC transporter ATP-binding protein [Omnitrophica bacterium RIFCSPHIGHO2_02_FULL_51_18]|nr:MAG: ABC transporter ATP-binding protein [Omnitrophica bacterium RIFCSPHIGHO2_02_FULL_51_18]
MESLVAAKNICKIYPDTQALDNLSLTLKRGEILGLLGPNGAGKTTAIHIFLGLLTPTSGEVSVFGLSPLKYRHAISQRLNFSSAYAQLPSNLKVMENLAIFSKLYDVKNHKNKIDALLKLFEITYLKNRLTGALSAGEKTRLNLCKCLLNDPELLLLDEPTASLDPEMADTVRKILKNIQKERAIGILYTSHNMPEVEEICDRILFINEGKTIAEGTPKEVLRDFESKTLEQVFIRIVRSGDLISGKAQ